MRMPGMRKPGVSETRKRFTRRGATSVRKRAVNLSVDGELLEDARTQGLNLSQAFEDLLRERLKEQRIRRFEEENREAFENHNRFIEKHGIWSKKYRAW